MTYIGIDLGTTNSAICSYDGETLHPYKSPEQHDVTPSAIFIDPRGNKYVGLRAYNNAARNPASAATLFKRFMGTSTPINLPAVNLSMTPEQCSAEILRVLFGYLPEGVRNDENTGTVITVPAAFNQMQKNATMSAAEMASIGRIALMQEPVAAVMSVMRRRKSDGIFIIYDLGGGTLDVAVAESTSGRVNLLEHGGIAMCGGREFDLALYNNVVKPWLVERFNLPENLDAIEQFKPLRHMAIWATEKGKIQLSQSNDAVIGLSETELNVRDLSGKEIYLDIPIDRARYDRLIQSKVEESIVKTRETLKRTGFGPNNVERIVFVGGPTNYEPLRDKVALELGIAPSSDVNPMMAVAEGAALFAESIDWGSKSRGRKSSKGALRPSGALPLSFNYIARTPDTKAKLVVKLEGPAAGGVEFQVECLDTGWSSGRIALKDGAMIDLPLAKPGENTFKVWVFDARGGPVWLGSDKIVISRTAASIDAIPASHSIAIEAREKIGGRLVPVYLVREGDSLPKKGEEIFKSEESLKAGSAGSLNFKIWEVAIEDPIHDNTFLGLFRIGGTDFDQGVIAAGADLVCSYEIVDSGALFLDVSVPSIRASFRSGNFYYPQQIDYANAAKLLEDDTRQVRSRLDEMAEKVDDDQLDQAREKLKSAESRLTNGNDPETTKQAMDNVQEARRLLALTRQRHLPEMRELELDHVVEIFDRSAREHARPSEISTFESLTRSAQRAIENPASNFESFLDEMRGKIFGILFRQDWFVVARFKHLAEEPHLFPDAREHAEWVRIGKEALRADNIDKLREVVMHLDLCRIGSSTEDDMLAAANIVRVG
jgi:molecular chaperone DnaK